MNSLNDMSAYLLEDFDIIKLSTIYPELEVGVNTNRIYIQITKFFHNPYRRDELQLLNNALSQAKNANHIDTRYTAMRIKDILVCFGPHLTTLPKSTFLQFGSFNI